MLPTSSRSPAATPSARLHYVAASPTPISIKTASRKVFTPVIFDNQYFVALAQQNPGVFSSDQGLMTQDPETRNLVLTYARSQDEFFKQWKISMKKLSLTDWGSHRATTDRSAVTARSPTVDASAVSSTKDSQPRPNRFTISACRHNLSLLHTRTVLLWCVPQLNYSVSLHHPPLYSCSNNNGHCILPSFETCAFYSEGMLYVLALPSSYLSSPPLPPP
jgi:hypothetical protein